jgi:D-aminopeptidase
MSKGRLRDLGIKIGKLPTGKFNAITDVNSVLVGHVTIKEEQPDIYRTGVTVIMPRDGLIGKDYAFAGYHSFNGCGEMTGIAWLKETGYLSSPIGITSTYQVGLVRDYFGEYSLENQDKGTYLLPVVAETYDGWLSAFHGKPIHDEQIKAALLSAKTGPVEEGCVGGGTGMICYEFKAGIGTASRLIETSSGTYTIGVLVQANFGMREQLLVDGAPVGKLLNYNRFPGPWQTPPLGGSIIVIIATDAPLLSDHCRRLAQRATIGLAHTGAIGYNSSGDLFLAFATGNHIQEDGNMVIPLTRTLSHDQMNPFFDATVEAVEESILNSLCAAETTHGQQNRVAYAIPPEELVAIWKKYKV